MTSKSAITPSFSGLTATMLPGVRPIMRLASTPTATTWPLLVLSATTLGSLRTIPRPRTYTRVFAVPRSTAMSRPRNVNALLIGVRPTLPIIRRAEPVASLSDKHWIMRSTVPVFKT